MCQICRSWFHFAAAIVVHINCSFEFSIFYLHELLILWLFHLFVFSSFKRVFLSIFISSLSFTYSSLSSYFFSVYLHLSFSFHSSVYLSIICHLSFEFTLSSLTRATAANQISCVNFSNDFWFLLKITKQNFSNDFWFLLKIFRLRNELYSGLAIVFVQRQL
jgi:hypothetical protein